jgi:hypothetical protein
MMKKKETRPTLKNYFYLESSYQIWMAKYNVAIVFLFLIAQTSWLFDQNKTSISGRRGRNSMVVGFTTNYPISSNHH